MVYCSCQSLPDQTMHTGDYGWGSDTPMTNKAEDSSHYADFEGKMGVVNLQ